MNPAYSHDPRLVEARQVAQGTNSLVLLREVEALDVLYYVGKRRPISELPPEQQEKIREAYKDCHWASDYGVEAQAVCTSKALAEQMCKEHGPNWFYHALPINTALPEETAFFRAHVFPGSEAVQMYENLAGAIKPVPVAHLRALEEEIERLRNQVDALTESLRNRP